MTHVTWSAVVFILSLGFLLYGLRTMSTMFGFERVMSLAYFAATMGAIGLAITTPSTALGTVQQDSPYDKADTYQQRQIDKVDARLTNIERWQVTMESRITTLETLAKIAQQSSDRLFWIWVLLGVMFSERVLIYLSGMRGKTWPPFQKTNGS